MSRLLGKEKRLIIVGAGWSGQTICAALVRQKKLEVVGFVDDKYKTDQKIEMSADERNSCLIPILGPSSELLEVAQKLKIKIVILAVTNNRENHILSQIIKCHEADIKVIEMPDLYAHLTGKIPVRHINHHWIVPSLALPQDTVYHVLNNFFNYMLCIFGSFFIFFPLFPLIALAIKSDSKGPIFYRQKRVGQNGRVFNILKFRTMVKNADVIGSQWTLKEDNRITWVGRWLRKFRIDELPQLINILRGEMSLIGPRPEAVELVEVFNREIPFYEYRYLVRPGISGWAQVNYENTCSVEGALEKFQYDLFWIKNRSFIFDMKIIIKSIKVMLTGFGAI